MIDCGLAMKARGVMSITAKLVATFACALSFANGIGFWINYSKPDGVHGVCVVMTAMVSVMSMVWGMPNRE